MPEMIALAGGSYIPESTGKDSDGRASVNMQMEAFYQQAKDADYLIYNSTIEGEVHSLQELCDKDEVLKDFKAVKEGRVFCTTGDLYQRSLAAGVFIEDVHKMLTGKKDLRFMYVKAVKERAGISGGNHKKMGEKRQGRRYGTAFAVLAVLLMILFICNICIGSVPVSVLEVKSYFLGRNVPEVTAGIIGKIRLPRALAAMLLGGALALSGYLLQSFFRNPIAGPFVLGISSGAKLAVALLMILSLRRAMQLSSLMMITAAFVGAILSMVFVLAMSKRVNKMSALIVSGVMIGYICSAITDFIVTFAEDSQIVNLHNWSRGSFSGINMGNVQVMAVVVFSSFLLVFFLAKPISAYEISEVTAKSLGVNVPFLKISLVILSSILSACVVAFAGPVSFVGVATPHLVKRLLGSSKPILMIPACFLGGAVFCLLSDLIARMVFSPTELSISTVTAVFGAPVVLIVMAKRRKDV